MQVLLMFLNYVLTLFLVLLVLGGVVPAWSIAALPLVVLLEYKVYRATLTAAEQSAPHGPPPTSLTPSTIGANP